MPYVLLTALLFALAWAPSFWVRHRMRRHGADRPDLPGTGSELAVHLPRRFGFDDVGVERTDALTDHPEERDASFGEALPVPADGDYVPEADLPAVRRVLQAAALTYAARAPADLVNIGRWAMILRRRAFTGPVLEGIDS